MSIQVLRHRFCDYKSTIQNVSPRTVKWYYNLLQSFLKYSKVEKVEQITTELIENWLFWGRTQRSWSVKTHRGSLLAIGVFLDWCVKQKIITFNPAKEIPKPRLPKKIPKHLTLSQADLILSCARTFPYKLVYEKHRAVAIFAMFMYSGIRFSELVNLKFSDVDFQNNTISVFSGKGGKDRIIPLCAKLKGYLGPYLKEREQINPYSVYFFVTPRGNNPMGYNVIKRLFAKIKGSSGIYFTPHMLRHTFATLMLEGGCDIYSLSKMMGHSDIKTTTLYLSATVKHLQSQMLKHPL